MIPVGQAPHRELESDPGAGERLELVELAIADDERFEASRLELDREGPSYTVDTLRAAARGGRPGTRCSWSSAATSRRRCRSWREPEHVLALATVAGGRAAELVARRRSAIELAGLAGAGRMRFLDMPAMHISSSSIRARAATGLPIRYWCRIAWRPHRADGPRRGEGLCAQVAPA